MEAIEKVAVALEKSKGKDGYTLMEHLTEMIDKIMLNPKEYPLEKVEELSYLIKLTRLQPPKRLSDAEIKQMSRRSSPLQQWVQHYLQSISDRISLQPLGYVPDILSLGQTFQWAGVGFDQEEWFLIQKALKRLAAQTQCPKVRFWGKLLCSETDLYVIEMKATLDTSIAVPGEEARGEGINENMYWVASDLLGEWKRLPDIKGEHVVNAKKVKKILTGNLEDEVEAYPFFGDKEKYLIRAQIARISAATVLAPKGVYKEAENNREIEYDKEATVPGYPELKTLENWVHLNAAILNSGRTKHILPPGTENQEEELDKLTQNEPYIARLRPLNEDEKFLNYETAWQIRSYGDDQPFAREPPKDGTTSYSVIALRPYKWPGAVTVYQNGKWESLYIGDGIAMGGESFVPVAPAEVMQDPEDGIEQDEPNPKTEVEPIESDTDEEKKEEEKDEDE